MLLHRVAVTGGRREVHDAQGERGSQRGEESQRRPGAAAGESEQAVALAEAQLPAVGDLPLAADPTVRGQHHIGVLGDDEVLLGEVHLAGLDSDGGAPRPGLAVPIPDLDQLPAHQFGDPGLPGERLLHLPQPLPALLHLSQHHLDLQPGQAVDFEFQDGLGLLGVEREFRPDLLRGVRLALGSAHQGEHPVERVENDREPLEHPEPGFQLSPFVLESSPYDFAAERQEVEEQRPQAHPLRRAAGGAVEAQAGQIHGEVRLQRGASVEVREHLFRVGVLPDLQLDADIVGREIAHFEQLRQRPVGGDLPEALDELRLVDAVRNGLDDQGADVAPRARFPNRPPDAHRAASLFVDRGQVGRGIEDLAAGGEIRAAHESGEGAARERLVVQEREERLHHLEQVVRRDRGRHPDGDAGGAVHQQQRQPGGEHHRFGAGAVVGGALRDGVRGEVGEDFVRRRGQPALGVAHRRRRVAVE